MPINVRPATFEEILDLRHAELRGGRPRYSAVFPGDDDPAARHFAAVDPAGRVIGCATLHLNTWEDAPAYQLRGMATAAAHQRTGIGRLLLIAVDAYARSTPVRLLWCNARLPAEPFYAKSGWKTVSPVFDIPTAGPHVKMVKML